MKIYFDNAASTRPDPAVIEEMLPYLAGHFGNPSSTHSHGRDARAVIELARKKIAEFLGAAPSEIFFTSGGTEADNTALAGLVETFRIKNVITSPLEHHAVLHTLQYLERTKGLNLSFLEVNENGDFNYDQLENLLCENKDSLVSIMHANNETGNLSDLKKISDLCGEYKARFHSDAVQSVGKISIDLKQTGVDSIAGSGHKFHGPKGVGFLYVRNSSRIGPYLHGGGQERNLRSGTENTAGIIGMAKALEVALSNREQTERFILNIKKRMIDRLNSRIKDLRYNGHSGDLDKSLYTILNVSLPPSDNDLLLFQIDLKNIAVSGGSACASGALKGSHVLGAMKVDPLRPAVRFSFSKFNTPEEVDYAVDALAEILEGRPKSSQ
ncbi:MAG TPA: cysteine desulfurase family protein [Cyclobacteriaceae bacterium]|nr:cysteine desulfurase family protein [Cyclobacteriaceae bacterium]